MGASDVVVRRSQQPPLPAWLNELPPFVESVADIAAQATCLDGYDNLPEGVCASARRIGPLGLRR